MCFHLGGCVIVALLSVQQQEEYWLGAPSRAASSMWLVSLGLGLLAPIIAGVVLAPDLLQGAMVVVGLIVALFVLAATAAYTLEHMTAATPVGLVVRPERGSVAIVFRGVLGGREIPFQFREITRLEPVQGRDRDGYLLPQVDVRTRGGESFIIPCEIDQSELTHLQGLIGLAGRRAGR